MTARPRRFAVRGRQRGVAVITALLLTTLAITIVASLFWQQQVQVRSMENQRLHLQTRWILRGALDWARLILQQETGSKLTTLDGVWATPLAETRLDQYIERERVENENFDATLSGQVTDAQARYNLANLALNGAVLEPQMKVFERLLQNLQLNGGLARAAAQELANSQRSAAAGSKLDIEPLGLQRIEDLLAVPGFTQQAVERLRDYVIVLPVTTGATAATKVNVNTAPPEVLSALVENFSVAEAGALAQTRKRTPFVDIDNFKSHLGAGRAVIAGVEVDVRSDYFLVLSRVRLDRAALDAQALIRRPQPGGLGPPVLLWIREH